MYNRKTSDDLLVTLCAFARYLLHGVPGGGKRLALFHAQRMCQQAFVIVFSHFSGHGIWSMLNTVMILQAMDSETISNSGFSTEQLTALNEKKCAICFKSYCASKVAWFKSCMVNCLGSTFDDTWIHKKN